ncbi:hypothetical protein J2W51_002346 [Tardiphaga robiniae]|uniref:hypothetical protein n=1 Tax=Tardiphaga robiniae TaxID=943830 RepID=UPI0028630461|nr:hypothetical protein [Tardiphaga robiniae]MDR6659776.1 hypothetical protein [Tardiphaga robiniae]
MGTKSRDTLYGSTICISAEKAAKARREADTLACVAWNYRMLSYKGPTQPSPMLGAALNAGFRYLEVRCLGCDSNQTVDLTIIRRPKETTPIHALERAMRCKNCSQVRGYPQIEGEPVLRLTSSDDHPAARRLVDAPVPFSRQRFAAAILAAERVSR